MRFAAQAATSLPESQVPCSFKPSIRGPASLPGAFVVPQHATGGKCCPGAGKCCRHSEHLAVGP